VQRWAHQHGHKVISEFSDEATSGASLKLLLGLQRALDAAASEPRPFDAIVVDQLSRLSRDIGDTDTIIKRLRFIVISVIAVADNINTADDTAKISVTVKSLVNELYLDDLRKATKRGLDGQFLKGYATGGRTYGYLSEPAHDSSERIGSHSRSEPVGYRIKINPVEAAVVRRIFESFRDGSGEKLVAKQLNAEQNERLWRHKPYF
jgi:site-specific DNA recombinase